MHQLLVSILSTLIIPSSGLPSFPSGPQFTCTQALPLISSPPKLSPLNLSVPSIPPTSSHPSNLTVWPPVPAICYLFSSTIIRINALSVPAGMPPAGAMFEALNRMKYYLDGLFSSPHDLLPPYFSAEEAVSTTTWIGVTFSSGQGNWYTWALARTVLVAVAGMELNYGSVQLDEVIVSVLGEQGDRTFRLEKFDKHPGNIILPRTLPSSSRPSLSLLPNRTLISADHPEWSATPFTVAVVQGSITLTILELTPVQDYPTIKEDLETLYDELGATGHPQDLLPSNVSLQKGRVTVRFYSTILERSDALQILFNVGVMEAFHGAAEFQRAALVIDGKQGRFSLRISRGGVGGLSGDAEPTISRRSLPSNNKEEGNGVVKSYTVWPTLPIFRTIWPNLYITITVISPATPPYNTIIPSIIRLRNRIYTYPEDIEPFQTYLSAGRVDVYFTEVVLYSLTAQIAVAVLDAVVAMEVQYGPRQLDAVQIWVNRQYQAELSLYVIN